MTRFRWVEPCQDSADCFHLADSPLLCEILVRRGLATPDAVSAFVNPSLGDLGDPYLLPDMAVAVERIRTAISNHQKIAIFGDYDADGITSTSVLKRSLDLLGADVTTCLPHREKDGYGLNLAAVDRLASGGVSLLIALDCGTHDAVELARAHSHGMQTIVVDHHHVGDASLRETAFVSPQRADSTYPFRELAAVGVTYHLVRALVGDKQAAPMLPLVALGTVADVVPLVGENRVLTSIGLKRFARDAVTGLTCLATNSGIDPKRVNSYHCGFILGPRINAAGRMATPDIALELLLTDDEARATELAAELGRLNAERQRMVQEMLDTAERSASQDGEAAPLLVVGGADWSVGLVGLVAGRLTERFNRPSLALAVGEDVSRGSARSIAGFNIVEALTACQDILVEHGGHSQAAGLTVLTKDLVELEARLIELSSRTFGGNPPPPTLEIDAEIHGRELTIETAKLISSLEPFGQGNPAPRLLLRSVMIQTPRRTRNGKHVQFQVETSGGASAKAIYFNGGEQLPELLTRRPFDLVIELKIDEWKGRRQPSLDVLDFRPAEPAPF